MAADNATQHDPILRGARHAFASAATFSLFANLLILAIPLYSLQVYDRVLASRSGQTLAALALITMLALLVHAGLEAVRTRLMVHVGLWLDRVWSPELLGRAVRHQAAENHGQGAQIMRDLGTVRGFVTSPCIFHLFDSPWVPLYAVVMFLLHPMLGWLTVLGAALLLGLAFLSEISTREPLRQAGRQMNAAQARAEDYVRRAEVIEAMGMLPGLVAHWSADNARTARLLERGWQRGGMLGAGARFVRFSIQVAVLTAGAWLVIDDQMSSGSIVAASILLTRALAPVESMVTSWKSFVGARTALARVHAEMQRPPPRRAVTRLPAPRGGLVLEGIGFRLPHLQRPILDEINLSLAPGESLGIIGPSAAGKSSLARIILGILAPSSGRARLDGADVSTWPREDLGRHMGYLPQDIELFPGTVKLNIARMGQPDDAKAVEAAQWAGMHEAVLRLPLGYDTEIGEAVRNLSGGQRQRIAIARALYGDPRLLVLDEPNSNLDADGENALIRALLGARERGATVIVIAHRARVLMSMDRLLLLKDGKVEMMGPREEVLARVLPPAPAPAAAGAIDKQGRRPHE